jgi:2-oxoglutarate dehydrogenase E2 component (dihydrolipoamide succinyltransferase)
MALELTVPEVGESITEVMIGIWKKQEGDVVATDDPIVEIESDKATVELPAPSAGTLTKILKATGERATVGEVIGYMEIAAPGAASPPSSGEPNASAPSAPEVRVMPAAARVLAESGVPASTVVPTGPGSRVTKADAQKAVAASSVPPAPSTQVPAVKTMEPASSLSANAASNREERYQLITPIRQRIAERLVEAQHDAALLTTFNEVDMSAVKALRGKFKDQFLDRYGVKLGFMSFFVRAVVEALRAVPQVNAEFREPHIVYRDYYDIGIAVGGGKGLVVPVIRNAEMLSFAQIETTIGDFAQRAGANKLKLEELQGGTFTISNGGVYGSMLSTPIINPPQSGILGLHAIQDRPVAVNGQVVVRPMMYLALTYDHRLVDGREAVTFLKRIKDTIEDPSRLMLEV